MGDGGGYGVEMFEEVGAEGGGVVLEGRGWGGGVERWWMLVRGGYWGDGIITGRD